MEWVWLLLRGFYLFGVFNYITSRPPILKVTLGGGTLCSDLSTPGWQCRSCVVATPSEPSRVHVADAGAVSYVLSGSQDLWRGVHVIFDDGVVHVQCEWRGLPNAVVAVMSVVAIADFHHAVFYDATVGPAHALTWMALAAIAYKAFHFAFAF